MIHVQETMIYDEPKPTFEFDFPVINVIEKQTLYTINIKSNFIVIQLLCNIKDASFSYTCLYIWLI